MAHHWLAAFGLVFLAATGASLADEGDSAKRRPALAAGDDLGLALFPELAAGAVASEEPESSVELAASPAKKK
jgi:hypothetical protein